MAEGKIRNRRKGPDILVKTINNIAILSWIVIFGIFITFSIAKPRLMGVAPGHTSSLGGWDTTFIQFAFYLMIVQAFLCAFGLAINANRLKRKTDRLNKSLIIFGCLSILGIMIYIILG
ncbi:MAG TPA: hypothetical protein PK926_05495 [Spirochaetota bacterium]|nr:hypothetical protein [Spirochaetota bacterium]HPI89261.1 hypothetical protein [Spirochaetota bacterium]HPR48579.1 hypothetical protein [Spirochaetota bacterium]